MEARELEQMDSSHPACQGQSWNSNRIPLTPNPCYFLYSMSFQDMEGKDPFQVTEGQLHMSTISSLGMEPRTQEPYQLYFSARPEILPLYFILEAVFRS